MRDEAVPHSSLVFSSKLSKWLDDESLVKRGGETNWKRQYKLRHNWSRGSCDVSEIEVAERPPIPPLLVQLHEGIAVTVDSSAGLRAWNITGQHKLIANTRLGQPGKESTEQGPPTSLAINSEATTNVDMIEIAIGFDNGRFSIHVLDTKRATFTHRYTHSPSPNGTISAIAFSLPYILTLTGAQLLSLYTFASPSDGVPTYAFADPPRLLSLLKSHTVWPPLSLSLRTAAQNIVASIAYALPTYLSGWSVGLQELRITSEGEVAESRLASAVNQGFTPLSPISSDPATPSATSSPPSCRTLGPAPKQSNTKPTSLSYTHPYLLASHPDNTLTLYLVTSSSLELSISSGSRLWGHTSSVSGAHVGGRGKAVSVSSRGDELRIWELEGGTASAASRRRLAAGAMSVQVQPEKRVSQDVTNGPLSEARVGSGLASALGVATGDMAVTRGWVGFDDEKVLVLKEKQQGSQALYVYDFT